jgi:hypothetical protein
MLTSDLREILLAGSTPLQQARGDDQADILTAGSQLLRGRDVERPAGLGDQPRQLG